MKESVSFKVYLKYLGSEDQAEIRLFVIDKDVCTSFAYLQKKLATVFPGLQEEIFTINWTDEDGDIVTIATDEELTIALSRMKEPVYKIRVCVKGGNKNDDKSNKSDINGEVHSNMSCDGCGKSIEGYFYKCVYFDRNMCGSCIAFGDTSTCAYGTEDRPFHCMVKFTTHMANFGGAGFWKTDKKIHSPKFGSFGSFGEKDSEINGSLFGNSKINGSLFGNSKINGSLFGSFGSFGEKDSKINGSTFGSFGSFGEKDSKINGSTLGGASCGLGGFGETDKKIHGPEFGGAFWGRTNPLLTRLQEPMNCLGNLKL